MHLDSKYFDLDFTPIFPSISEYFIFIYCRFWYYCDQN